MESFLALLYVTVLFVFKLAFNIVSFAIKSLKFTIGVIAVFSIGLGKVIKAIMKCSRWFAQTCRRLACYEKQFISYLKSWAYLRITH